MASIYDKSSLVLIPSGTKTGKVYSQKPVSGDGDFTFTRSSAATRVNADGFIEKETQNLLTKSNTLSAWSNANTSETGGQSGYDGSSDAWLVTKSAANAFIGISASYSGVFTQSIYAKAGSLNWIALQNSGISQTLCWFDLQNGQTGFAQSSVISHSITDVGGGWYRCEATYNGSSSTFRVFPSVSDNNTSGTSGNVYLQDAQLEQGLVARDYIETTTTAVEGGITDNVPRLDYTDSSCPALLLEPQRTNIFTDSEYFNGSDWILQDCTITNNAALSPEGVQNASLYTSSTEPYDFVRQNISFVSGTTYTYSVFAKAGTSSQITLAYHSAAFGVGQSVHFNLSDGTYTIVSGTPSVKVEDFGNGWYRCAITATATASSTRSTGFSSAASGSVTTLYLYGAQMEVSASYPTSYIPTYGSSVTRTNDYMKLLATDFYNTTSYTYFLDINLPYDVGTSSALWKDNDNLSSNGGFQLRKTSPTGSYVGITTHNGTSFTGFFTNVLTGRLKMAIIYNNGEVSVYYNGVQSGSAISVTGWNQSTNHFKFQDGSMGTYETQQFLYLPTALTDQEAIDLTTI